MNEQVLVYEIKSSADGNFDKLFNANKSAFLLAEKQGLDVKQIVMDKIKRNGEKYPVDKAKGSSKKYDEL